MAVWFLRPEIYFLKLIRRVVPLVLLHICALMGDDCIKLHQILCCCEDIPQIIICDYYLSMYSFMPADGVVLPIELDLNHRLSIKYTKCEKRTSSNYAMIIAERRGRVVAAANYRFCGKLTPSYLSLKSP